MINQVKQPIQMWCDGACKGNPGPGGWGVYLMYDKYVKKAYGYQPHATNNQMELLGAIEGLMMIKTLNSDVELFCDSTYVVKGMTQWIDGWKRKNWKGVANSELWQRLDSVAASHNVSWNWVKGHSGNIGNEVADKLANGAITNKGNWVSDVLMLGG